jgi:hypothetical protein
LAARKDQSIRELYPPDNRQRPEGFNHFPKSGGVDPWDRQGNKDRIGQSKGLCIGLSDG